MILAIPPLVLCVWLKMLRFKLFPPNFKVKAPYSILSTEEKKKEKTDKEPAAEETAGTPTDNASGQAGGGESEMTEVDDTINDTNKLGKVNFSLKYEQGLTLKVIRARDLVAKDLTGTSDPYIKILLLPDKKNKITTNIKHKNLNPRWNETFAFEGYPLDKLQKRTLLMVVMDHDRLSRDDPIGEIALPLQGVDLEKGTLFWMALQPSKGGSGKLGELLVSLCYESSKNRITVGIIKCRELKAMDISGYSDPYVKVWLCLDDKQKEKKKTVIRERQLNPAYCEFFSFDVTSDQIRETSFRVSVMDYDRMGRNELIGGIILGRKSGPIEVKHWNAMFCRCNEQVSQWHILRELS